jgi:hypothetical protein
MSNLVKHHKNVINNLTTEDSLSYADVKQRLMDIDTSEADDNTALFTSKPSGNKKKGKMPTGKSFSDSFSPKSKTCTWCKKIILENPKNIPGTNVFAYRN